MVKGALKIEVLHHRGILTPGPLHQLLTSLPPASQHVYEQVCRTKVQNCNFASFIGLQKSCIMMLSQNVSCRGNLLEEYVHANEDESIVPKMRTTTKRVYKTMKGDVLPSKRKRSDGVRPHPLLSVESICVTGAGR